MLEGLKDPLAVVQAASLLDRKLQKIGLQISTSTDFEEFERVRLNETCASDVSPMFDTSINKLNASNAFWISLRTKKGELGAIQAFRLDTADGTLADWAMRWMVGLYILRSELVVPARPQAPAGSVTREISGSVVYQGELWVAKAYRDNFCSTVFPRLGMVLCLLKWQPNAMWGLMTQKVATRGLTIRIGYPYIERGFLQWKVPPKGADKSEVVVFARKQDLEFIADQTLEEELLEQEL